MKQYLLPSPSHSTTVKDASDKTTMHMIGQHMPAFSTNPTNSATSLSAGSKRMIKTLGKGCRYQTKRHERIKMDGNCGSCGNGRKM